MNRSDAVGLCNQAIALVYGKHHGIVGNTFFAEDVANHLFTFCGSRGINVPETMLREASNFQRIGFQPTMLESRGLVIGSKIFADLAITLHPYVVEAERATEAANDPAPAPKANAGTGYERIFDSEDREGIGARYKAAGGTATDTEISEAITIMNGGDTGREPPRGIMRVADVDGWVYLVDQGQVSEEVWYFARDTRWQLLGSYPESGGAPTLKDILDDESWFDEEVEQHWETDGRPSLVYARMLTFNPQLTREELDAAWMEAHPGLEDADIDPLVEDDEAEEPETPPAPVPEPAPATGESPKVGSVMLMGDGTVTVLDTTGNPMPVLSGSSHADALSALAEVGWNGRIELQPLPDGSEPDGELPQGLTYTATEWLIDGTAADAPTWLAERDARRDAEAMRTGGNNGAGQETGENLAGGAGGQNNGPAPTQATGTGPSPEGGPVTETPPPQPFGGKGDHDGDGKPGGTKARKQRNKSAN